MLSSVSKEVFQSFNDNYDSNKVHTSSKLLNYNNLYFQTLDSFHQKKNNHKKHITSKLTALNFDSKNVVKNLLESSDFNKDIYNDTILSNYDKKMYTQKKDNYISNSQVYTSENENILNLPLSQLNLDENKDYSNYDIKSSQDKIQKDFVLYTPRIKNKNNKKYNSIFKKKNSDQNQINYDENNINYNNYDSQLFVKENNTKDYTDSNDDIANILNSSTDELLPDYNYVPEYVDENEPKNNFKLTDYSVIKEIGSGAEGKIYMIRWKKNNKKYALKKCQIMFPVNVKKRKNDNAALKNFIENTGCEGIIKPYATLMKPNDVGFTDCYEIMELAEKDWETEISNRNKEKKYSTEFELMEIFRHLVKTFALLQYNHITHRDIKPQNILFSNGKMKICDFGNARVLKGKGVIIQRIRGSELFMSPIVFRGYRSGIENIRHNAYKSDVYSLGVCFFLAASLSADGPNYIRNMEDNKKIKKVLDYNLKKKYSKNLINIIMTMLKVDEKDRPDFIELEMMLI